MSDCTSDWYAGFTCDHLYADCPNRTRNEAALRHYGEWFIGSHKPDAISKATDPHGGDVCGMCLHRHNRTVHAIVSTPTSLMRFRRNPDGSLTREDDDA